MRIRRRGGATTAALLLAPALAAQQTGGVHLTEFDPRARLGFEYRDERRSSTFSSLHERETSFREDLLLHARGDVYHPRLLDFDLRTELGLEQTSIRTDGAVTERSLDATNTAYDARLNFFKEHPYSATLYGTRHELRTRQPLFRTTEAIVAEEGVEVQAKQWVIPTRVRLRRYDYDGRGADTNEETRQSAAIEGLRQDDGALWQYGFTYEDVDLRSGNRAFVDKEGYVSGAWNVGHDDKSRVSATARAREQTGDLEAQNANLGAGADLQWTDELSSHHAASFDRNETAAVGSRNDTTRVESSLQHRLYESLVSEVGGDWLHNDFDGGRIDRDGAHGDLRYKKNVGFGQLTIGARLDGYVQDENSSAQPLAVLDEAHVFTPGTLILLDNFGVDAASVVVTDAAGLFVFVAPQDYRITVDRGRARIDVPLGSRITPGQTILIDYLFAPRPDVRFKSTGQTFRTGLRVFDWALLELGYEDRQQDVLSGNDTGLLQDERARSAGLELFWKGQSVRGDYEDRDATYAPYERTQFSASSSHALSLDLDWQATASTFTTRFKEDDLVERGVTLASTLAARIGENTNADLRGEWRRLDLRTDRGNGYLLDAVLAHRFRKTTVDVRASYGEEQFDVATDQRHVSFWCYVTRTF